jgi:hypothetical protein
MQVTSFNLQDYPEYNNMREVYFNGTRYLLGNTLQGDVVVLDFIGDYYADQGISADEFNDFLDSIGE